jgi:hypothetical protein
MGITYSYPPFRLNHIENETNFQHKRKCPLLSSIKVLPYIHFFRKTLTVWNMSCSFFFLKQYVCPKKLTAITREELFIRNVKEHILRKMS